MQQAVDEFGRLDIVVNNAGILRDAMSFNITEAEWDSVIEVHLKGHLATCHHAVKHWRALGKAGEEVSGRIINTASESGLYGQAGQINYATAKAGIVSMTIVLAREMKKYGVTANVVCPRALTRMTETVAGAAEFMTGPEWEPENISPLVVFLASDAAADVSGQVFVVWGTACTSWRASRSRTRSTAARGGGPRGADRPQGRALRRPPQQGPADGLRAIGGQRSDATTTSPTGRCSSTSCASWRSGSPTSRATSTSTPRRTLTFRQWDEQSNQAARWLVDNGVRKGDRVAIALPNEYCLRWIVAYAAVHKAGRRDGAREHAPVDAGDDRDPRPRGDLGDVHVQRPARSRSSGAREVPSLRSIVCADGPADGDARMGRRDRRLDASEIQVPVDADDMADIMYTSGTTGLPKGVLVRHRNVAMIPNAAPHWTSRGWLHGAPLFTFAGMSFIFNPMKMGLTGLYMPRFDVDHWFDVVERDKPMMIFLVPAMAELITASPRFEAADLSAPIAVSIGSAPLAPATLKKLQDRMPQASVINSYGLTEAGPAFITMPKEEAPKRIGSVGKPMAPMEVKVVDPDTDELRAPNDVGELLVRLPGKRREYYKDDGASAATWTDDGWLRTGDLAYLDADGFVYISGPHQGHDHPRRQQHLRHRRGSRDPRAPRRAGSRRDRRAAPRARRRRRRVRRVQARRHARRSDAHRVLRRAPRRLQAPAPPLVRQRAPRNATGKVMKHKLRSKRRSVLRLLSMITVRRNVFLRSSRADACGR